MERCDILVIGGGIAGITAAKCAAAYGVKVILAEKGTIGGQYISSACIPSKAFIHAANVAYGIRQADNAGISFDNKYPITDNVFKHIEDVCRLANKKNEHLESYGIQVIKGEALFISKKKVKVGNLEIKP